jgi:hypothetical protein
MDPLCSSEKKNLAISFISFSYIQPRHPLRWIFQQLTPPSDSPCPIRLLFVSSDSPFPASSSVALIFLYTEIRVTNICQNRVIYLLQIDDIQQSVNFLAQLHTDSRVRWGQNIGLMLRWTVDLKILQNNWASIFFHVDFSTESTSSTFLVRWFLYSWP